MQGCSKHPEANPKLLELSECPVRNIVKITLPTEMSSIDETTTHTIKAGGFFRVAFAGNF